MRCFAKIVLLAMALHVGQAAMAQTFEQALDAYERKDYKTAFAGFMRLAQGDDAAAPDVEAPKEDQQQKLAKYRKAAEQGDAAAQFIMGLVYFDGRGVAQDDRQAEAWYRKSAEQGYASAQVNLGLMYFFGRGVSKDDQQAVAWLRKAMRLGSTAWAWSTWWVGAYPKTTSWRISGLCWRVRRGTTRPVSNAINWRPV